MKMLSLTVILLLLLGSTYAQEFPDNPLEGKAVFSQKRCNICHSTNGEGGDIGPDLAMTPYYGGFLELATVMWNHAPSMSEKMDEMDVSWPSLSDKEVIRLFAFLYYLRFIEQKGNWEKGELVIKSKRCMDCHSLGGEGKGIAPPLERIPQIGLPVSLATQMWNHGETMMEYSSTSGIPMPKFSEGEFTHLAAYISKKLSPIPPSAKPMAPGNPRKGKELFSEKGCIACHSIDGEGGAVGPDLGESPLRLGVMEIAGRMWNHAPEMASARKAMKQERVQFSSPEMNDVIAYLYFLGFYDKEGSYEAGRETFIQKGCSICHSFQTTRRSAAPDLTRFPKDISQEKMIRLMWNHAPTMQEMMTKTDVPWPVFTASGMRNLFTYLSRAVVKRK